MINKVEKELILERIDYLTDEIQHSNEPLKDCISFASDNNNFEYLLYDEVKMWGYQDYNTNEWSDIQSEHYIPYKFNFKPRVGTTYKVMCIYDDSLSIVHKNKIVDTIYFKRLKEFNQYEECESFTYLIEALTNLFRAYKNVTFNPVTWYSENTTESFFDLITEEFFQYMD